MKVNLGPSHALSEHVLEMLAHMPSAVHARPPRYAIQKLSNRYEAYELPPFDIKSARFFA